MAVLVNISLALRKTSLSRTLIFPVTLLANGKRAKVGLAPTPYFIPVKNYFLKCTPSEVTPCVTKTRMRGSSERERVSEYLEESPHRLARSFRAPKSWDVSRHGRVAAGEGFKGAEAAVDHDLALNVPFTAGKGAECGPSFVFTGLAVPAQSGRDIGEAGHAHANGAFFALGFAAHE